MVYLVFLWILNVIVLRGCIIADFFLRGKRVVGVNVRPSRGCCLVCGFVGGWLLGCRESAKSVFQKSELASCSRSDSGLLKNNADFRQPRISSPPAEAEPDSIPFHGWCIQREIRSFDERKVGRQRFAGRLQGQSLRLFDGRVVGVGAALDAWNWRG